METVRRHYAFITSADASGPAYAYTVAVAPNMLACGQNEQLRVTLMSLSFFNDYQATSAGQTHLEFIDADGDSHAVELPTGNVPFQQLAEFISAQYDGVSVIFDEFTNQLLFDLTNVQLMRFTDDSWKTLGFPDGADVAGGGLVRGATLRPPAITDLVVYLEGVSQAAPFNLSTASGRVLDKSNALLAIPVDCAPFSHFTWESQLGAFSMALNEKHLSELRIRITDFDGAPLTSMPHHRMVLRFEVERARDDTAQLLAVLSDIKKYNRLSLMSDALKNM